MTDKSEPQFVETRDLDGALLGGLIIGAGQAIGQGIGPTLGVLTDHWLNGPSEPEPPSIVLPPGVNPDNE
jgi:hypothetical protein